MYEHLIKDIAYLNEIAAAIKQKEAVLFVGNGLSVPLYGTWQALVSKICDKCRVKRPTSVSSEHLMRKADRCLEVNESEYCQCLYDHFSSPSVYRRDAYEFLAMQKMPIYVTTNYDPMLESALSRSLNSVCLTKVFPDVNVQDIDRFNQTPTIFYIHGKLIAGDVLSARGLILGHKSFEDAYETGGAAGSFLQQLSAKDSFVFIGFSFSDPYTRKVFSKTSKISGKTHYALMPMDKYHVSMTQEAKGEPAPDEIVSQFDAEMYANYGIRIIRYPQYDSHHTIIDEIMKYINSFPEKADPFARS